MANPSLVALQTALASALANAASIQALVGDPARVYDHVPQDATFPYIEIGDVEASADNDKDTNRIVAQVQINVWTGDEYAGRGSALQIMDAIYGVLHRAALSISGNAHVLTRFVGAETGRGDDGTVYGGIALYDIVFEGT